MFLALREIRHEPGRFALVASVITLITYLTFFLASLASGLAGSYRAVVDSWSAGSVIVTEASNESISASRMTDAQVASAMAIAEDADTPAATLVSVPAVAQLSAEADPETGPDAPENGSKTDVFAFGIDLDGRLSPAVVSGSRITDPTREVLADESLQAEGLAVGDTVRLLGSDHEWTVTGLTRATTFQAAPILTMDAKALRDNGPAALSPATSAVVLDRDITADSKAAAAAPAAGLSLLTSEELIQTLPGYSAQVLTFTLMIGALVLVASLVLGIFLYVLTLQKRPVLGILRARGVPTGYLIRSGGAQTAVLAAAGVLVGLLLTLLTSVILPDAVPFRLSPGLNAMIALAFILVSVLGGLASVRVIARIDPVEAIS
ncbi:putative ABC transport system permease protein [Actinomyces ruminicola]|uniref:Putative ABC transport system permease protein n=1 Tax=Actinomyces ruminicola TaxID=332524 RepID=A0A1H0CWY4_9ACTO|nr:ABC transporter permease [Actinomyces ruminicola]SDN62407.1 putative ABC transport system permease protein [Actinomyces ruminicola]